MSDVENALVKDYESLLERFRTKPMGQNGLMDMLDLSRNLNKAIRAGDLNQKEREKVIDISGEIGEILGGKTAVRSAAGTFFSNL